MANQVSESCKGCSYCHSWQCTYLAACFGRNSERVNLASSYINSKGITNSEWLESLSEVEKMLVLICFVKDNNPSNPEDVINSYKVWLTAEHNAY